MSNLRVQILNNSYDLSYPTVGQCIDIKRLELSLSGNKMNQLISSNFLEDQEVALDIKAVSIISILIPEIKDHLKCETLLNLRYDDWQEVMQVFNSEIFPWYTDWKNSLRDIKIEDKLTEKEE